VVRPRGPAALFKRPWRDPWIRSRDPRTKVRWTQRACSAPGAIPWRRSQLIIFGLYSPNQRYDALFLANYANININDALYRVRGVGQVLLFGATDYAMRIWVKPDVLAKLGLTVPDLVRAVSQQSTVNPAGRVGAEPAPLGKEMTYTVRAQGRLQTADEFSQIVVRSNPDGSVVRLSDVARIELGALNYQQISRVRGQPGSIVAVFQTPGSNALDVANGVKAVMEELKQRFRPTSTTPSRSTPPCRLPTGSARSPRRSSRRCFWSPWWCSSSCRTGGPPSSPSSPCRCR